ncbi:type I polyketide synthase [Streptomyces sp. SID4946]|uniref:type I polyketide synthase n=1 Tax=Streptomyces TaxID=1883 RepID=UPI00081E00D9|nr:MULTISPECIES: type I polyketide synthase [unclassified Streptomyces]MYQ96608.1 type I polyketide synthase [Streptomyces sp. SID4946]SCG01277.1 8,8a-deoxyoleandolide synthase [Streptomyces sp. DconLS]SCG05647.1 8,8a-deoxyoleandolide synthase [Streptomyces sp. LamerLS-31b]
MSYSRKALDELKQQLAGMSPEEQLELILGLVRNEVVAAQGGGDARSIAGTAPFRSLGIVREKAAVLVDRLTVATGVPLSVTALFDFPDSAALARHLLAELTEQPGAAAPLHRARATVRPPSRAIGYDDPIAVVGMACRFGGGISSPEQLWQVLEEGSDVVTGFPTDREWDLDNLYHPDPDHQGTSYTRAGAFLQDVAGFDADFFGISPREALAMDPQQRILLEVAWEAVERSGIAPHSLRESQTGVFVGVNEKDYLSRFFEAPAESEGFLVAGNAASVVSGRISYVLGLQGPSLTVDTACSSSLVALHQACRSLRDGECALALSGGVAVMSSPGAFIDFARKRVHAADGRCKAYADEADGTGWGEGAGLLVLERLSDARRAGHRVLAVIRGSAVNQDGASNGLSAPNGPSQERVIRQALADAGLVASQVDAVDGHGTGTPLGDTIEVQALLATYGQERLDGQPLWLGSVKSNLGHTQAASGVAGVIKMIKAMEHRLLPSTLHVGKPNTRAPWENGAVRVLQEPQVWPDRAEPMRAGVSSFGVSGTNVHLIIEQPPSPECRPSSPAELQAAADVPVPLVLTAKSPEALREQAGRLRAAVQDTGTPVTDIGSALVVSRSHMAHRAVLVADDRERFAALLATVERGEQADGVTMGVARPGLGRPVFVLPGQGAQWAGMGADLLDTQPVFARSLRAVDAAFASLVSWSVEDILRRTPGAPSLDEPEVLQPVSFAVAVALADLWRAHGVEPAAVLGHSQGEVAAAVIAGALTVEDAARIMVARTRALMKLLGKGAMAAVELPLESVEHWVERYDGSISVATVNSPTQITLSGEPEALDKLLEELRAKNVRVRRIPGAAAAGHSRQVEEVREELVAALADVSPHPSCIPFYSSITGGLQDTTELGAEYWYDNARRTVRFDAAVRAALADGHTVFLESGPHPILTSAVQDVAYDAGTAVVTSGTLRRDESGPARFLDAAAELFTAGVEIDWSAVFTTAPRTPVALPTYPFQHRRFWLKAATATARVQGPAAGTRPEQDAFWRAVEEEDVPALAGVLGIDDEHAGALGAVLPAMATWQRRNGVEARLDSWRYQVVWEPLGESRPDTATDPGPWLVVVPAALTGGALTGLVLDAVCARTGTVLTLPVAHDDDRHSLADRIRVTVPAGATLSGVVSLLALDESPSSRFAAVPVGTAHTVALAQALGDVGADAPLWLLTSGAVATGGSDPVTHPVQAQSWALGRVLALEHPERFGGVIDLPARSDASVARTLTGLLGGGDDDQLAVRATGVLTRRLVRGANARWRPADGHVGWRPDSGSTVLVTGGTGVLAGHVATWLAEQGAGHLILASRRGPQAPGIAERVRRLEELGAEVTVVACDVRDREAVRELIAGVPERYPLTAVVHTAGIGRLQALSDTTPQDFSDVFAAKAAGARHLHELTVEAGVQLRAFVLFSAVSAVWGVGRQGHYGAANAYLLALAEHRRNQGLAATAIAWTGWTGGGMAVEDASQEALRRHGLPQGAFDRLGMTKEDAAAETGELWGLRGVDPRHQMEVLRRALDRDEAVTVVADVDWERFTTGYASARRRPLLAGIPEALRVMDSLHAPAADAPGEGKPGRETPEDWQRALASGTKEEQQARVLDLVRARLADVLGHSSAQEIDADRAFLEMGLDSVSAVQLRNRLGTAVGLRLPATIAFNYPTPRELAHYVWSSLALATVEEPDPVAQEAPAAPAAAADDSLVRLYTHACAEGRVDEGAQVLRLAGRLRPTYGSVAELASPPRPVRLAEGPVRPLLVCLTPYVAPAGAHQYARFAASFRGERDLWALGHPGFSRGEPLPADVDLLFATQAHTVLDTVGDDPFVLLGYSSGGWVAHGTAAHLQSLGRSPAGVVMLDSFSLRHRDDSRVFSSMMNQFNQLSQTLDVGPDELTAMGRYMPMFEEWAAAGSVPQLSVPTLLVRAREQAVLNPETGAVTPPPEHVDTTVVSPGNHYSMMQEYAPRTAEAVRDWLLDTFSS